MNLDFLRLYRSLFHWREDLYAYRREKEEKSGYYPVYQFDRNTFRQHQAKGGNLANFEEKILAPLTDSVIIRHLKGEKVIWIYPLLKDNTSWFIVADFDEKTRKEDSNKFLKICEKYEIPAYLERSRSGNGGHVWIFFESPLSAKNTRKLFFKLLQQSLWTTMGKSFDRIFPNQDFLKGKWFGNLIALPLQWKSLQEGNSTFLDPQTFIPYSDQRSFLHTIKRLTTSHFNQIFSSFHFEDLNNEVLSQRNYETKEKKSDNQQRILETKKEIWKTTIVITVKDKLSLQRSELPPMVISFLYENLKVLNTDYLIKKKMGRSTYSTEKFFSCIEETENEILIPRGFCERLTTFLDERKIDYQIQNMIPKYQEINFPKEVALHDYQYECIKSSYAKHCWIIVAPPWFWKTLMALDLITKKKKKTLIVIHRQQLLQQWMTKIETFLGIPKKDIWMISGTTFKIWDKITIAMIQTLSHQINKGICSDFWTLILDECHHIPAETFRTTIGKFCPENLFWFTATPFRKNNDEAFLFAYLGPILAKGINPNEEQTIEIIIKNTETSLPFDYKTDSFELLAKTLIFDLKRNQQIINDLLHELSLKKKILVLTERKEHLEILQLYLKHQKGIITLTGDDSQNMRKKKINLIQKGDFQLLFTTGQLLWEGLDLPELDTLFLIYPCSFEGKLIQYLWRIQRGNGAKTIYDYADENIKILSSMFKKRLKYYQTLLQNWQAKIIFPWEQGLF